MTDAVTEPDDRSLVAAHLAGDPEAFGILFTRHRDRLWAVALRTTGDPEEAADALQDAMVAAFRRADSYRGDAAVTTWLHRIVVNACLDRLRRRKVRLADPLPVDMQGYSVDEAAAILECAPGTVKSRCSRGRARLAPLLADLDPRNRPDPPGVPSKAPDPPPDEQEVSTS